MAALVLLILYAASCTSADRILSGEPDGGTGGLTATGGAGQEASLGNGAGAGTDGSSPTGNGGSGAGGTSGGAGVGGGSGTGGTSGGGSGGSSDAGPDASSILTPTAFCDRMSKIICDWGMKCKQAKTCFDVGGYTRDSQTCLSAPLAISAGRLAFDPVEGAKCLAALDVASRSCAINGLPTRDPGGPCSGVYEGLVRNGGACYYVSSISTDECMTGHCYATTCPGTCTPYRVLSGPCGGPGDVCEPGTYCQVNVCTASKGAGQVCSSVTECATGLACVTIDDTGKKQCTKLGAEGDACAIMPECEPQLACENGRCVAKVASGGDCQTSAVCPSEAPSPLEVCIYGIPPHIVGHCGPPIGDGQPCARVEECNGYQYEKRYRCASPDGTSPAVCLAPQREGYPCNTLPCGEGLYCNMTAPGGPTCAQQGRLGNACNANAPCYANVGVFCMWDGFCRLAGDQGQSCNPAETASCKAGLFCDRADHTCEPLRSDGCCTPHWVSSCARGSYCACNDGPCLADLDPAVQSQTEKCATKIALDGACSLAEQCADGFCSSGKCTSRPIMDFCDGYARK